MEQLTKMEVALKFSKFLQKGHTSHFLVGSTLLPHNNAIEYEACIMGLRAALGLRVKELEVYGDSALIIS